MVACLLLFINMGTSPTHEDLVGKWPTWKLTLSKHTYYKVSAPSSMNGENELLVIVEPVELEK